MRKGSFHIEENKQLLMIRPSGAWSEQVATRYVEKIDEYLSRWQANFAGFVDLRQWQLGTPQALKIIADNDLKAITQGYKLEFHYGNPQALSMQISREHISPEGLNVFQTTDLTLVQQKCSEFGFDYEPQALADFLNAD
ncbi:hypothetical protein [Planctobacterium marinum]|uniref:Uncharacterized protein n=1 Tax=Planctobacterium marinum TaxID=1631968 RepID=A0AA48HX07_9ALTE|nr:hypothetical protein MACH26_16660 [Planctobacterium marinum]